MGDIHGRDLERAPQLPFVVKEIAEVIKIRCFGEELTDGRDGAFACYLGRRDASV